MRGKLQATGVFCDTWQRRPAKGVPVSNIRHRPPGFLIFSFFESADPRHGDSATQRQSEYLDATQDNTHRHASPPESNPTVAFALLLVLLKVDCFGPPVLGP